MSSLNDDEWISLRATLHALDNQEFQCGKCLSKHSARSDYQAQTDRMRVVKGCEGISGNVIHRIKLDDSGGSLGFRSCVGNYFDASVPGLIEAQRAYERGVMPFPGAMLDQPAKMIEIFSVIEGHRLERMESLQREAESKRKTAKAMRGRTLG